MPALQGGACGASRPDQGEARLSPSRAPRQAFLDFNGCCALQCASCPEHFCAWCLQGCGNSQACHAHVAACPHKPEGAGAYFANDRYRAFMRRRREVTVREMLGKLDAELAGAVFDALRPQISDLAISRPGGEAGEADAAGVGGAADVEMADAL